MSSAPEYECICKGYIVPREVHDKSCAELNIRRGLTGVGWLDRGDWSAPIWRRPKAEEESDE